MTKKNEALADSALDRMAENARELGLDYEPPCKIGSQCTNKCPQCDEPHEQPHCNDCGGFDPECPLAQPAQQQEPVAWRTKNATPPGGYVLFQQYPQAVAELGGEIEPLYTSPPASKPLTDEQAEAAFKAWHYKHGNNTQGIKWVDDLLRSCWKAAIEAKLREKNA